MIQLKQGVTKARLRAAQTGRTKNPTRGTRRGKPAADGLTIERTFSTEGVSPSPTTPARSIFKQENVEVPEVLERAGDQDRVSKYFYGDISHGTDLQGRRENSVRQLIHRVTRTIADWGWKDGYFADRSRRARCFTTNSPGCA
jgi:ribonucleoside-diphosphate reductase alpha chain